MKTIEARVVNSHSLRLSRSIGLKKGSSIGVQKAPYRNSSPADKKSGLLSSLKKIKIKGPVDFARNIDTYAYGTANE